MKLTKLKSTFSDGVDIVGKIRHYIQWSNAITASMR